MKISLLEAFGFDTRILKIWNDSGHSELLPIQKVAIHTGKVLEGKSAVIFSPTSSGKTFVGEMAAVRTAGQNRRAIYLVPQKALAEEKYREFKGKYSDFGIRVVISTRDRKEHDTAIRRGEFHIAVIVFEKLQALLVACPTLLRDVGTVIIDELQMIGDKTRGAGLEILLTKILLSEGTPQVIGLSAVLNNANGLADWLGAILCEDRSRPVELRKGVLFNGRFRYREYNGGKESVESFGIPSSDAKLSDVLIAEVRRLTDKGEQCLVFCKSKDESEKLAKAVAKALPAKPAANALDAIGQLEDSQGKELLEGLLSRSVAYHNANLDWDQRDVIEGWFRKGEISVICATSTLAMGLNLPAKNVFIDPKRWDRDAKGGWSTISIEQSEYENTSGRAGRFGLEGDFGRAILIAVSEFEAQTYFDTFVKGTLGNVEPMLNNVPLSQHILGISASSLCQTKEDMRKMLLSSYTGALHWRGGAKEVAFDKKLDAGLEQCLSGELMTQNKHQIIVTAIGKLAAAKGLTVDSAIEMRTFAKKHADVARDIDTLEILWCLTGTECGAGIHFNLSTPEKESGRYPAMLKAALAQLPESACKRMIINLKSIDLLDYEIVKRIKKTLLLHTWIMGKSTREIETQFRCFSGAIQGLAGEFAWLAEALGGIAKASEWPEPEVQRLLTLSRQLLHGVTTEGIPLASVRVRGLGRVRIGALLSNGLTTLEKIVGTSMDELQKLVTLPVARNLLQNAKRIVQERALEDSREDSLDTIPEIDVGEDVPKWTAKYFPTDDMGVTYQANVTIHIDGRTQERKHLVLVQGKKAWLSAKSFDVILRMVVAAKKTDLGWVDYPDIGEVSSYHQAIRRLKTDLVESKVDADNLIENSRAKQYRISVPPQNITIDETMTKRHYPESESILSTLAAPSRALNASR
ncbi:MAG: DEAD/DEAH box helicase [Planctomycetota bacterium]